MAELLHNPIRPYAWGSRTVLAQLQGRSWPTSDSEAELWIGGHCTAPSTVVRDGTDRSLHEIVVADPTRELGAREVARFGPRLPFLAKLLAVERPLSIQVHPDDAQAAAGYAAQTAGVGAVASRGEHTYSDGFGKPELLVTRTSFELLRGMRPVSEAVTALSRLGIVELDQLASSLTDQASMRRVLAQLLGHDDPKDLIERVVAACGRTRVDSSAHEETHSGHDRLLPRLAALYPGDPGVLVALLLNYAHLPPGVATFTPPGVPHAYISGTGFEVMASSDNVLRGGLTSKKIDIPELLALVKVESAPIVAVQPTQLAVGLRKWSVPVAEFTLLGVDVDTGTATTARVVTPPPGWAAPQPASPTPVDVPLTGPRLVICDAGTVICVDAQGSVAVTQGQAAYCAASAGELQIRGTGSVFVVGVNGL